MSNHNRAQPWKMKGKYLLAALFVSLLPSPLAGQDAETLSQACDAGDMLSCESLGRAYEAGLGVTQDLARAVGLFQRACDGELMLGCNHLGSMYRTGAGVTPDLRIAASLYERACDGGMMEACANLGMSYERGDGVTQDAATAVTFYQRACDGGVTWTCDRSGIAREPDAGVAPVAGFRIAGLVADAETGDPLSEAIVDMPGLGIRVITDASGRVDFGELPVGQHPIKAERVGYEPLEGELLVPGDREVMIPLDRTALGDLEAPGRIVGRVLEGGREYGISDVAITVLTSTPVRTLSDPQGRFSLTDVETGLVDVQFERLGYAARTATVIVQPDGTVEINASMSAQPIELEPIEVVVRSRVLERNGFYQRGHLGYQLTRTEIEARNPIVTTSLLRTRMGVIVREGTFPPTVTGRAGCRLLIYLDGIRMDDDWDFNTIPPEWLEGMEVIKEPYVPPQYFSGGCGVVLIWMTRGA